MGFANPEYYDCDVTDEYLEIFNTAVREEMEKLADGGRVSVGFNRLYFIGEKS